MWEQKCFSASFFPTSNNNAFAFIIRSQRFDCEVLSLLRLFFNYIHRRTQFYLIHLFSLSLSYIHTHTRARVHSFSIGMFNPTDVFVAFFSSYKA